jgi:hypothetical protein
MSAIKRTVPAARGQAAPHPPGLEVALYLLLEARQLAEKVGQPEWDFAVELGQLREAGATHSQLRWLVCSGYALHAVELTGSAEPKRAFALAGNLCFGDRTVFALTEQGQAFAASVLEAGKACVREDVRRPGACNGVAPHWDGELRELSWQGHLVKRFRVPAPNQEIILAAFEEEGWPPHIDDPLPPAPEIDSRRRLHDTINSLNRNQIFQCVRFRANGHGNGILWELL